jgi:FRG domain
MHSDFRNVAECLSFVRDKCVRGRSAAETYVWVPVWRVECDPVSDMPADDHPFVLPASHRFRHAVRKVGGEWQQALPRFLYRGESALHSTTETSFFRMRNDPRLSEEEKLLIRDVTFFVEEKLCGTPEKRRMSQNFAAACSQHYGLPSHFIDFSSDIGVAGYFATSTHGSPEVGTIGVMDLAALADFDGDYPVVQVMDLTEHPWAARPGRQLAYGIGVGAGQGFDIKREATCERLRLTWYTFAHTEGESGGDDVPTDLLSAEDDVLASIVLGLVDLFVAKNGAITLNAATWLAQRLAHTRGLVASYVDNPVETVNMTWSQYGFFHDEAAEREQSILLWSGAVSDRRPPPEMCLLPDRPAR